MNSNKNLMWFALVAIVLWDLLWSVGLLKAKVLVEIDDVYMPHNGPRALEREDYYSRFVGQSGKYNMIIYRGGNSKEALFQHTEDMRENIGKASFTYGDTVEAYNSGKFFAQTVGQPLRYTKLDCFQEGSFDYHTVLIPQLNGAGDLLKAIMSPLDNANDTAFTGPWLNPYNFCLYADLFQAFSDQIKPDTFGACRGFLNPEPEKQYEVLEKAYDWVRFFWWDFGFAAQTGQTPCAVHLNFKDTSGMSGMIPDYSDCQMAYGAYNQQDKATKDATANAVMDSQQKPKPASWSLTERVLSQDEVDSAIAGQCYMWDGFGKNLPAVPNAVTNRNDGLLSIYFTMDKKDFCTVESEEKDCYREVWDFGDRFGEVLSTGDQYAFSDYTTESDAIDSYKSAVWIVVGGISAILSYSIIVGCCHGTPLLMAAGVALLLAGMVGAVGLGSVMGVGITPPMLTVFPLLTLGIGVDDMFILTCDPTNARSALPSITTTSLINILVGCLGYTNPIPYVANFSLYFGLGSAMLYLTNVFGVAALCSIFYDAKDLSALDGQQDVEMTPKKPQDKESSEESVSGDEKPPKVPGWGRVMVLLAGVVATILMIAIPYQKIEQDMSMNMLYKKGGTAWNFFVEFRKAGELHTATMVTKETDFAHRQADWPVLIKAISDTPHAETIPYTWLEVFQQWGNPVIDNNARCSASDVQSGGVCGPKLTPADGVPLLTADEVQDPNMIGMPGCIVLPEAAWKCAGIGNVDDKCNFGDASGPETAGVPRYHPERFDQCVNKWVDSDDLWNVLQAGFQCDLDGTQYDCAKVSKGERKLWGGRVNASKTTIYLKDVKVVISDWLAFIKDVREAREASPFDTYLYGGYHNAFSSFEGIWEKVYRSLIVAMSVAFVVIAVSILVQTAGGLWMAIATSFITCVFMLMAWFCTVSMLSVFDLPMMPPSMVIVLLTLGVSVEVMGHIGQEYVRSSGSRVARSEKALGNLWWPLGNGLLTTIIAVSIFFVSQWYFMSDMIGSIVLISLFMTCFMGMLVFPAGLSLFGPPCECGGNVDVETETHIVA